MLDFIFESYIKIGSGTCITVTEVISVWNPLSSTFMGDIFRDSGVWNGGCIRTVCLFPTSLVYLPVKRSRKWTLTAWHMTKDGLDTTEPHDDSVVPWSNRTTQNKLHIAAAATRKGICPSLELSSHL